MKKEQPKYLNKISAIIGDCGLPNLGIAEQYQEILKNEVIEIIKIVVLRYKKIMSSTKKLFSQHR